MPRTKPSPTRTPRASSTSPSAARTTPELGDVLTLAEAAAYLRVSEPDVVRLIREQGLPGRQIGSEWRFLKSALQKWLGSPSPPPDAKGFWKTHFGAFKDDPYLQEIVREAYKQRGRPEDGEW